MIFFKTFKRQKLEKRLKLAENIILKYHDRIPVIIDSTYFKMEKHKYIVPKDMSMGNFIYMLKTRISLTPEQSIFLLCNNTLINGSDMVSVIYDKHKEIDNFLYLTIALENVFGGKSNYRCEVSTRSTTN